MSFIPHGTGGRGTSARPGRDDNITASLRRQGGTSTVAIRIGADVIKRLKWRLGSHVTWLEGMDGDEGVLQLVGNCERGRILGDRNGAGEVRIAASDFQVHGLPAEAQPAVEITNFKVIGQNLLLELPSWAVPVEPTPPPVLL